MDKQALIDFGIDYDAALARCVDSTELFEMLLHSYADGLCIEDIAHAYAAKDWETLFALVHETKGVSGNLGLKELFRLSAGITQALRDKRYDTLDAPMAALQAEMARFLAMIAQV